MDVLPYDRSPFSESFHEFRNDVSISTLYYKRSVVLSSNYFIIPFYVFNGGVCV
ncbi:MAG: hypothetical protein QXF80_07020 [Thermoplasmatales archaeon]